MKYTDWSRDYWKTLSRSSSENAGAAVVIAVLPITFLILMGIAAISR